MREQDRNFTAWKAADFREGDAGAALRCHLLRILSTIASVALWLLPWKAGEVWLPVLEISKLPHE